MAELARIATRIESLGQLGELVDALRSMAASRVHEAQEALNGTNAFRDTVSRAIRSISPEEQVQHAEENGPGVLLMITSETGFVGGFNTRISEQALNLRAEGETLAVVGRRGQILASEHGLEPDMTFQMASRATGVTALARRISARLERVSRARVVFARHKPGGTFDVAEQQILPMELGHSPDRTSQTPLHHLPVQTLMDRLASEYLFAGIAQALMESLVSENNARLMTMDAASRNITETVEKLRHEERAARQEQITSDMLDVIVGTEAVNAG